MGCAHRSAWVVPSSGISRWACAHATLHLEWVWTTAPISSNARYRTRCVGVSVDGRRSPTTTLPSRSSITMSSARNSSYATPLGLIATSPRSRSIPLALPHVSGASPCAGSARFASSTASTRPADTARSDLRVVDLEQLGQPAPPLGVIAQVDHEMMRGPQREPVIHESVHALLRAEVEVVHLDLGQLGRVEHLA